VELVERDLAVFIDVRFVEHFVLHFVAQTEVGYEFEFHIFIISIRIICRNT
jgi:hypothetical protein